MDNRENVMQYLSEQGTATTKDIAETLRLSSERTRTLLREMVKDDLLEAFGANRNRTYAIKRLPAGLLTPNNTNNR